MGIFTKTKKKFRTKDVRVATTRITSSYSDGSGNEPRFITWYFLVHKVRGEYYEIFSNRKIEKESDIHNDGITSQILDIPYIEKIEALSNYLVDPTINIIDSKLLFDFILDMNIQSMFECFCSGKKWTNKKAGILLAFLF